MSFENTDQYIISGKIGEGGMGVVYLAQDTSLQRAVAIKELTRPKVPGQDATEDRFQQEALALARLNHPNITHLYAFLPKGETYWMVMEYVPGKTLEEWLHYRGKMNAGLACSIVIQMLEGLQHAHRKGIIHRDLKPGNVMISEEGEVKIMDFGIARIRDSQRITKHGKSVGTLAYMAPEQIKGEEGDERTDIYAAGNILYELLSGHTPFEAETDYHLMKLKLEEAPAPLTALAAATPPDLQKVIFRALDRNPAKRFESVAALKEAIERSMQGKLLKPEVLNPMLSDLQQEESFVRAVKQNPLHKFSGMIGLPVRAAAGRISGGFRRMSGGNVGRPWILLAASVLLCAALLAWHFSTGSNSDGDSAVQDSIDNAALADRQREAAADRQQSPMIENGLTQNTFPPAGAENSGEGEQAQETEDVAEKRSPAKKKERDDEDEETVYPDRSRRNTTEPDIIETPPARALPVASGPVTIPSGRQVRVVLDEDLSSEARDRDGSTVHLHSDENVVIDGRTVIKKGAKVTGKIVDVRTSAANRAALIGFVIQQVQATDGEMLKLRSERFRSEADAKGQAVYYRRGQSFTVELKGGKMD